VQRDVRAGGGVGCRRQVVGVGFARYLEYGDGQALGQCGTRGEPLGVGPALQHGLGVFIALVSLFLDVVEGVEHQQRVLERVGGNGCQLGVVEQLDECADVVAAQHGAEQFSGVARRDERTGFLAQSDGGEVGRLDLGGVVDTGRHTVGEQIEQELFLAGGRV